MGQRDRHETELPVRLERDGSIRNGRPRDVRHPLPRVAARGSRGGSFRTKAEQGEEIRKINESLGLSFFDLGKLFAHVLAVEERL